MLRIILFLCFLFSFNGATAQRLFQASEHLLANPLLVRNFLGSRCLDTDSWQQAFYFHERIQLSLGDIYFPSGDLRTADRGHAKPSRRVSNASDSAAAKVAYPFAVFFSPTVDGPLYLIFKGFCKGYHISIPVTWSGYYFVTILDQEKPSLFSIDATLSPAAIQYRKACALDLFSSY